MILGIVFNVAHMLVFSDDTQLFIEFVVNYRQKLLFVFFSTETLDFCNTELSRLFSGEKLQSNPQHMVK